MANKLVDLERLSKLAKALDARTKAAVAAEKERALAAEGVIDGKVSAETDRATKAEQALEAKINTLNGAEDLAGSVAKKIKDAVDPIKANVSTLQGNVESITSQITGLDEKITTGDAKALEDAKSYADTKIADLVNSAPEDLNTLKELADAINQHQGVYEAYVGTVNAQLAGKVDKVVGSRLITDAEAAEFKAKAEVSQVEAAKTEAKGYTDTKFAEANDTISGVSTKVGKLETTVGNGKSGLVKDVADLKTKNTEQDTAIQEAKASATDASGKVNALQGKVTTLETAVGKAGGDNGVATGFYKDIADLKTKNTEQDNAIQEAKASAEGAASAAGTAASTANAAKQQAATNLTSINQLKTTVGDAESGLVKDVNANKAAITAINHSTSGILAQSKTYTDTEVGKLNSSIEGVKSTVEGHTTSIGENTASISKEVSRAKAAEQAIDGKVTKLNGNAEVVGSVDNKIKTALANIPNNDNVKTLLSSLVNSLDFVVTTGGEGATVTLDLSLGGVESIAKKTLNIPMATNADIDEIISSLDA